MPSFRYLQSTVPNVGKIGLVNNRHSLPWKNFPSSPVERCGERQHEAGLIGNVRRQDWGLGSPEEAQGPVSWGGREKASERRCLLPALALLTLCLCRAYRGLGKSTEKQGLCVPYKLTPSFPSKVTCTVWLVIIHVLICFLQFSIVLHVLKLYVHSIMPCVPFYTLFSLPLCL